MFKALIALDSTQAKKFCSLVGTDSVFIDIKIEHDLAILISSTQERKVICKLKAIITEGTSGEFRIEKKLFNNLITDGILEVEIDDKVRLNFTDVDRNSLYSISTILQITDVTGYEKYLFPDYSLYNEINISDLKELSKVASSLNKAVAISNGVAFIEYNNTFLYKQIQENDLTIGGTSLRKLTSMSNVYKVGNDLVGIDKNLTFVVRQYNQIEFRDYESVREITSREGTRFSVNLSKLVLMSKKCRFKEGSCKIRLSDYTCSYYENDVEYIVGITATEMQDSNIEVDIPNWIINNILLAYPDLMTDLTVTVFDRLVLLTTSGFNLLYKRSR